MSETENKIKKATTDLLLRNGSFGLTMAEVAEASKVSRTVIHYYFRSKENLLAIVGKEIVQNIIVPKYKSLLEKKPLKQKVQNYVYDTEKISQNYPYLDVYIVSQYFDNKSIKEYFEKLNINFCELYREIQKEIDAKNILYRNPIDFMIDLFSLSSYASIYIEFVANNPSLIDSNCGKIKLESRKEMIIDVLFSEKKC